ncbi:Cytochrome [Forsythia ovata]|uniref:Cytochrome n=1 Tax=Forsythia ovata TaxID=205694 RepID=A0ABD1T6K0_9LAMI
MAYFLQFLSLFLIALALLISPACSLTCTSQTFTMKNTRFTNCTDLPVLKAYLHWTYDPTAKPDPTLSIAYIAPPPKPDGWVAWALNPTGAGMVGSQSLVAFRETNGSMVVKTYYISSYGSIEESKILYNVLNKRAEYSDGVMRIFATLAMPGNAADVNQVWQVGGTVKDGVPENHDFSPENLSSKGTLELASKADNQNGNSTVSGRERANDSGESELELYGFFILLVISVLGF